MRRLFSVLRGAKGDFGVRVAITVVIIDFLGIILVATIGPALSSKYSVLNAYSSQSDRNVGINVKLH